MSDTVHDSQTSTPVEEHSRRRFFTRAAVAAAIAGVTMIMTYDRERVVNRAGRVSAETQRALDRALATHLALAPI